MSTNPQIDRYLHTLRTMLRLQEGQRRLLEQELLSHLRSEVEELQQQGMGREQAIRQVLDEFGDVEALARDLAVWRPYRKRRGIRRAAQAALLAASVALALLWPYLSGAPGWSSANRDQGAREATAHAKEIHMRRSQALSSAVLALGGLTLPVMNLQAQSVPQAFNHQGVISVNGVRFTGTGTFRFAIIDPQDGDKNRWTNDGSQLNAVGQPTTGVSLPVADGIYSTRLGESPMAAIGSSVFADDTLALRIWFTHDASPAQQLSPDHPLTSVPFALMAGSVPDGSLTAAKFDSGIGLWTQSGGNLSFLGGSVGIGVAPPTATLDVAGTVQATGLTLPTGASAGHVLTSDGNGNASWQPASTGTYTNYGALSRASSNGELVQGQTDEIFRWPNSGTTFVQLTGMVPGDYASGDITVQLFFRLHDDSNTRRMQYSIYSINPINGDTNHHALNIPFNLTNNGAYSITIPAAQVVKGRMINLTLLRLGDDGSDNGGRVGMVAAHIRYTAQ